MFLLLININISYIDIAKNRKQTGTHDNALTLRTLDEMCESPWQALTGIIKQSINSPHQWILTTIDIVLIGFAPTRGSSGMDQTHTHHTDIAVERKISTVAFVVEPVVANNANSVTMLLNIFDHIGGPLHCCHVLVENGMTAKYGIFNIMNGT